MLDMVKNIDIALGAIREKCSLEPTLALILGTGLGKLAERIDIEASIDYGDIPGFVRPTVESHGGSLILGRLAGVEVVAMKGRFHYYEGYSPAEITFPVRVAKALGANTLIVSNACGGMNPQWQAGDLMIIEDHINMMGINPLIGPNDDRLGLRFPDMIEPYNQELIELTRQTALANNIVAHLGIYVAVSGPNLETRAEYRFLRRIGADVVGMSTVPEVIVAVHAGMRVLGISVITDECLPDALEPADISKILKVAAKAEPRLTELIEKVVAQLT
ncbi:purine-nucleoside phosphorylase [Planctomycetota bacterium]